MYVEDYLIEVTKGEVPFHSRFEKYGRVDNVDIITDPQDVWSPGGEFTGFPLNVGEQLEISSSSGNDTAVGLGGSGARTVEIFNLLDDTGAALPNITVSLAGAGWVSLGALSYYRGGTRMKVRSAGATGSNEGAITLRQAVTTANIMSVMQIGTNRTSVMAYTVPLGKTLYAQASIRMATAGGTNGSSLVLLKAREYGGVFENVIDPEITNHAPYLSMPNKYHILPERTDIKIRCETVSDNNTIVTGEMFGFFKDN